MAYLSYKAQSERVRSLRAERMLTQVELAARAGLSEATVIRIEHGHNVGRTTLNALAEALGVDPIELVA